MLERAEFVLGPPTSPPSTFCGFPLRLVIGSQAIVLRTTLGIDVGVMILVGGLIVLPAAIAGLICASLADHWMPVPMRQVGNQPDSLPLSDDELPPLWLSVLPVALPVLLISTNTILGTCAKRAAKPQLIHSASELLGFHPFYLATAIGGGSLVGFWKNDSGFWIFAKMGGLTEVEALNSWTPMLVVLGVVSPRVVTRPAIAAGQTGRLAERRELLRAR